MKTLPLASATLLTVAMFSATSSHGADAEIRPFTIQAEESVLKDLNERLEKTRWPDQIPGSQWDHGPDVAWMRALCDYWRTKYDWRAEEKKLNSAPQFKTVIDGIDLHFIHVKSKHADATPLVLVHGWPGSVVEFMKVIEPLTDPQKHGGKAEDAFHVVVPSLPGFGFSSMPREPGWSSSRMAEVIAKLMARLGYDKYGAQGGDWGGGIVRWLASGDGAHCIGAHSNFPGGNRPTDEAEAKKDVTQAELDRLQQRNAELADHRAYGAIQGTRPLALAYGLNDSPAGLAAWIIDKFWGWSDHKGDLSNSFTKDELLTNIMVYWITQSMPSATRIYYESQHNLPRPASMTDFQGGGKPAPVGYALFPKEINVPPRAWVAKNSPTMIHWTEMPRGGHFAAMERPDLLVQDVRMFFAKVRSSAK